MPDAPAVAYRLLGGLQMLAHGVPVAVPNGNPAAVLALLVVRRNAVVSTDGLIEALWGEGAPSAARSGVQVAVSSLRRAIRAAGIPDPVETTPPGYRLTAPVGTVDVDAVARNRRRARTALAAGDPSSASAYYRAALDLWSGEPLTDLRNYRFAEDFAVAWGEERLTLLQERIDADLLAGHSQQVIGDLVGLTREHPLHEHFWVQLISALYRVGRQAEALQAARSVRRILAEELGIDPGAELQDIERRVLRQDVDPEHVRLPPAPAALETVIEDEAPPRGMLIAADGRRYPIPARGLTIGRLTDNDIVVDDSKVSRHHAAVTDTGAAFLITDLESTNGTRVDGYRLAGAAALMDGTVITIATYSWHFRASKSDPSV